MNIKVGKGLKILAGRKVWLLMACLILVSMMASACDTNKQPSIGTVSEEPPSGAQDSSVPQPTQTQELTPTPSPTPEPFGQPNIYMFMLDEYSSFDILSKYYKYDNKVFDDFLTTEGFNISRVSYSTDDETEHCFCDLLNLDYISRHLTKDQCYENISTSKLYDVLSGLGYSQFQISTSNEPFSGTVSLNSSTGKAAYKAITTGEAPSEKPIPDTINALLNNYPAETGSHVDADSLNQWGVYPSDYIRKTAAFKQGSAGYANSILKIFDYFQKPSSYAATKPRAVFCYMTATHVPFVFNQYGGLLPSADSRDWRDTNVYLDQYKFISREMMATVANIIDYDPNSIIIIMSDHGIRYHADCPLTHKFVISDKDACRIMNAVYIKGQKYDTEGLSGINTLRYILSLYEGQDFPAIQDPITPDSPDCLKGIIPKSRHN